jgi:hypothetical protein
MKLMTQEILRRFRTLGRQEDRGDDAVVVCKFFTPDSSWTWYATEFDEESREFFGLVEGFEVEFGYFSLEELETARGPLGLPIERDLYWKEATLGEVRAMLEKRRAS